MTSPAVDSPAGGGMRGLAARFGWSAAADAERARARERDAERLRREAFHDELMARLLTLLRVPTLPRVARELASWLVHVDVPEAIAARPVELGADELGAFEAAWEAVLGEPLHAWACSAGPSHEERPTDCEALPLLRSVRLAGTPACDAPEATPPRLNLEACWSGVVREAERLAPVAAVGWRVWIDGFYSLLDQTIARVPAFARDVRPLDTLVEATRLAAATAACLVLDTGTGVQRGGDRALRLVSLEFTPIQDFVFGIDTASPWRTDAALGGRSSFVRLLVDLGALAVLERLELPPPCLLNSAASKALLLVPDSDDVRLELRKLATQMDTWALRHLSGTGGLCMAHVAVDARALSLSSDGGQGKVRGPLEALSRRAAVARLNRFGLGANRIPLLTPSWDDLQICRAFCSLDGVTPGVPANAKDLDSVCAQELAEPPALSRSARMQLMLGRDLAVADVLLVTRRCAGAGDDGGANWHFLDMALSLVEGQAAVDAPATLAAWDIAYGTRPPQERHFKGLAIRPIALPRGRWQRGAIAMLKGDVDRLGQIFQSGLDRPSLGRSLRLSREVDEFFSIEVPSLLQQAFPSVQTVLCGGDDFVFVGPAAILPTVATRLHEVFTRHCGNPALSFSASLCIASGGMSLADLAEQAEADLDEAKRERNSICAHGVSVGWPEWHALDALQTRIAAELRGRPPSGTLLWLRQILRIVDALDETRHFQGARAHSLMRSATSGYLQARGERPDAEAPGRFWRLSDLLETHGLARHGRALRIPLCNLIQAYATVPAASLRGREFA